MQREGAAIDAHLSHLKLSSFHTNSVAKSKVVQNRIQEGYFAGKATATGQDKFNKHSAGKLAAKGDVHLHGKPTASATEEKGQSVSSKPLSSSEKISSAMVQAKKKFNELDANKSGVLDGKELMALIDWVWSSFDPAAQVLSDKTKEAAGAELLKLLDVNGNGVLDYNEFSAWFEKRCTWLEARKDDEQSE